MIVVDASALVLALTGARAADAVRARMSGEQLHAPDLVDYEFVSALRGMTIRGDLDAAEAGAALTDFDDIPLSRWPAIDPLRRRAYGLRHNLSSYDAAYVALAELLRCPLVTRDRRLAGSSGHSVDVVVH